MPVTRESTRALARRHLPTACLVSIAVVFQPLPTVTSSVSDPAAPVTPASMQVARMVEVTVRLCLAPGRCGTLVARVPSPAER